jgi:hypothetical protein
MAVFAAMCMCTCILLFVTCLRGGRFMRCGVVALDIKIACIVMQEIDVSRGAGYVGNEVGEREEGINCTLSTRSGWLWRVPSVTRLWASFASGSGPSLSTRAAAATLLFLPLRSWGHTRTRCLLASACCMVFSAAVLIATTQ